MEEKAKIKNHFLISHVLKIFLHIIEHLFVLISSVLPHVDCEKLKFYLFSDVESTVRSVVNGEDEELLQPFIPSSPMAIFMTALLCLVSGFVVTYTLVVLYRCICSRNYAEWRTSWSDTNDLTGHSRTQVFPSSNFPS